MQQSLERRLKAVEEKMAAVANTITAVTYTWVDSSGNAWMTVSTKPSKDPDPQSEQASIRG
jgi:hypothetical protein